MKRFKNLISGVFSKSKPIEQTASRWNTVTNIVFIVSNILAVTFILFLSNENTSLKRENAELRSDAIVFEGRLSGTPSAEIGDVVPSFEASNLKGERIQVRYDGSRKYLLYFFSPQCSVCDDQFPIWNHLATQAKTKGYLPFGVSLKSEEITKEKLKGVDYSFDILIMPNRAIQRTYRVVAEPLIMLVSRQGTMEWAYYGGLTEDAATELLSKMDSSL